MLATIYYGVYDGTGRAFDVEEGLMEQLLADIDSALLLAALPPENPCQRIDSCAHANRDSRG